MSYGNQGFGQQQGFGGPPPAHFQQGGYQGPPQAPYQGPPQGGFAPQQQHGGYPQQHQFPPQGQYPQQGNFGQPPITPPSPGYDPRAAAVGDASADAQALRSAMKGFGTDEATLIRVLSKPDPLQMALLRNTYSQRIGRNLEKDIKSETSSYFCEGLLALVRGPLMADVYNIHNSIKGAGTRESAMNDSLLGRSNADMRAIKQAYHETFRRSLESDVKGDLSMKTERLFDMVMQATRNEESSPIIPSDLDRDCNELHRATDGKIGTDELQVCSIISHRSDGQLRAIAQMYQQKYSTTLQKIIEREFSGHMKEALLLMVNRATDPAMTEAELLEAAMKGMGTKDNLLVQRVIRNHWNPAHKDQVKRAYAHRYKRDLISRVKGEVSGDYQKLMIAVLT
jgi:annexin A7/11